MLEFVAFSSTMHLSIVMLIVSLVVLYYLCPHSDHHFPAAYVVNQYLEFGVRPNINVLVVRAYKNKLFYYCTFGGGAGIAQWLEHRTRD